MNNTFWTTLILIIIFNSCQFPIKQTESKVEDSIKDTLITDFIEKNETIDTLVIVGIDSIRININKKSRLDRSVDYILIENGKNIKQRYFDNQIQLSIKKSNESILNVKYRHEEFNERFEPNFRNVSILKNLYFSGSKGDTLIFHLFFNKPETDYSYLYSISVAKSGEGIINEEDVF